MKQIKVTASDLYLCVALVAKRNILLLFVPKITALMLLTGHCG